MSRVVDNRPVRLRQRQFAFIHGPLLPSAVAPPTPVNVFATLFQFRTNPRPTRGLRKSSFIGELASVAFGLVLLSVFSSEMEK